MQFSNSQSLLYVIIALNKFFNSYSMMAIFWI